MHELQIELMLVYVHQIKEHIIIVCGNGLVHFL